MIEILDIAVPGQGLHAFTAQLVPLVARAGEAMVAADPHLAAREFFVDLDHPESGPLRQPGGPFRRQTQPERIGAT